MLTPPPVTLQEELGRGSTAVVWRAALTEPVAELPLGAEVACKRFHDDPEARACYAREAQVGEAVVAEGLIRQYAAGEDDEGPWVLMELIPGRNLAEVLAEERALAEPLVRSIGRQLSGALAALHAAHISHGDLKPENARLDQSGRSVLVDLGFAGAEGAWDEAARGTPLYLAPELTRGEPLSPAADVFSLGVVLYELVTGSHPFITTPLRSSARSSRAARRLPQSACLQSPPFWISSSRARCTETPASARTRESSVIA
ncbi:MAG: serine/threonine protein kinase [Planctomycetes bacterium]|nr:serine/threonine protein kinase [Planctomycetota bacterium]